MHIRFMSILYLNLQVEQIHKTIKNNTLHMVIRLGHIIQRESNGYQLFLYCISQNTL